MVREYSSTKYATRGSPNSNVGVCVCVGGGGVFNPRVQADT